MELYHSAIGKSQNCVVGPLLNVISCKFALIMGILHSDAVVYHFPGKKLVSKSPDLPFLSPKVFCSENLSSRNRQGRGEISETPGQKEGQGHQRAN